MQAVALRVAGALLGRMPRRTVAWLGRTLSRLGPLLARRRHVAARNLALAFPDLDAAARATLLRATLASNTTGALDTLCAWFAPPGRTRGWGDVSGLEVLREALREGRGAVLVGAHYDSVELAIRLVAEAAREAAGVRMGTVARRHNDPRLEAAIDAGRRRYLVTTIGKKDVQGLCGALDAGAAVVYVADQDASHANAFVPFFGATASTFAVIGSVLRRAGGVPVLMWSRRLPDGRLSIDLAPAPADFLDGGGEAVAARYMAWIEERARAAPEQYLWVHRRFKTRPPGEPDAYAR